MGKRVQILKRTILVTAGIGYNIKIKDQFGNICTYVDFDLASEVEEWLQKWVKATLSAEFDQGGEQC